MLNNPKFLNLVEAVCIIAAQTPFGAIRGTEICKNLNLPDRYLEPEFQNLVHSGILKSIRGPKGGYILAREKRNINLADIISALSNKENARKPSRFAGLVVKRLGFLEQGLKNLSIHEIIAEAQEIGVIDSAQKKQEQKTDFAI